MVVGPAAEVTVWRRWRWWRWWRRWRQSSSAGSWRNESLGIGRRRRRRRRRRKRRRQLPPIESGFARRTGEENSGGETASEVSTKRGRTFELGLSLSPLSLSLSLSLSSKHRLGVRTSPIRSAGSLTIFVRDKTRYPSDFHRFGTSGRASRTTTTDLEKHSPT